MRRFAKKPKILKTKIKIAGLLLTKVQRLSFDSHPSKHYWWKGRFKVGEKVYYVFLQRYLGQRRRGIDYIDLRYNDYAGKALTVAETKELYKILKNNF